MLHAMSEKFESQIRERAYAIWESEGRPHGRDTDHWLLAKQEIHISESESTLEISPTVTAKTPAKTRVKKAETKTKSVAKTKSTAVAARATKKNGEAPSTSNTAH